MRISCLTWTTIVLKKSEEELERDAITRLIWETTVLFRLIKKRSFNLLCVWGLFSERWQPTLFQIFFFFLNTHRGSEEGRSPSFPRNTCWQANVGAVAHGLNQRKEFGFAIFGIESPFGLFPFSISVRWCVCVLINEGGHVLVKGTGRMYE